MQMFRFDEAAVVEGNLYVATQVITFPDAFDLSALVGELIEAAPVFIDHVPRATAEPQEP